jgi:hypothetical protein
MLIGLVKSRSTRNCEKGDAPNRFGRILLLVSIVFQLLSIMPSCALPLFVIPAQQ